MSVSHFNLIHSSCHQAARQADSALRAPKREWEGATLRNGETLCNNLLPLKAAEVSDTLHAAAVASFVEGLNHAPHRQAYAMKPAAAQATPAQHVLTAATCSLIDTLPHFTPNHTHCIPVCVTPCCVSEATTHVCIALHVLPSCCCA